MTALDSWLRPWATGPIIIGLAIFCGLYMLGQLAFARTFTTEMLLDGRIAYNSAEAHEFLLKIKPVGQQRYLLIALGFDLVFPVCYALWICLLMVWLDPGQKRTWLLILPIAAGLCDWCENFGIARMIYTLPATIPDWLTTLTLTCTRVKWALLAVCTVVNGILLVLRFWKGSDG
jgi:hypothetical protein